MLRGRIFSYSAALSDNPFAETGDTLDKDAEEGGEREGDEGCGENLDGGGPDAEGGGGADAERGTEPAADEGQQEHVAEIDTVAGLGDGQEDALEETSAGRELAEEEYPSDGHKSNAGRVVDPRGLPHGSQASGSLDGEDTLGISVHSPEKSEETDGEAHEPHRQGD